MKGCCRLNYIGKSGVLFWIAGQTGDEMSFTCKTWKNSSQTPDSWSCFRKTRGSRETSPQTKSERFTFHSLLNFLAVGWAWNESNSTVDSSGETSCLLLFSICVCVHFSPRSVCASRATFPFACLNKQSRAASLACQRLINIWFSHFMRNADGRELWPWLCVEEQARSSDLHRPTHVARITKWCGRGMWEGTGLPICFLARARDARTSNLTSSPELRTGNTTKQAWSQHVFI